jgi:hypothetical protein
MSSRTNPVQSNLTSLSATKAWLDVTSTDDEKLLTRLIGAASRAIHAYLQRPNLFQHACNETYDGPGGCRLMLRQWPVLSVSAVTVDTTSVPASSAFGQSGYRLEAWDGDTPGSPQCLDLSGYNFWRGLGNIAVSYTAGYAVENEPWTVPGRPYQVTVTAPFGSWAVDQGVTANGVAMTSVTTEPTASQYRVIDGVYTFAAADTGKNVLISYSFVPADIEQACLELVGERYRTKDRIGEKSKSLGGQETISYSTAAMGDHVKMLLHPYRKVVPC